MRKELNLLSLIKIYYLLIDKLLIMSKKVKCKSGNFKTDYEILRENFK